MKWANGAPWTIFPISLQQKEKHFPEQDQIGMHAFSQANLLSTPHLPLPGPNCALWHGSTLCKSLNGRGALIRATRNLRLEEKTNRCYLNRITCHLEWKESMLPLAFKQDSQFPQAKSCQSYRAIVYPDRKDLKKVAPFTISHLRLLLSRSLPQVLLNTGTR